MGLTYHHGRKGFSRATLSFIGLLLLLGTTANSYATSPPNASAEINGVADPVNSGVYDYTITLHNTGNGGASSIGTFWFAWVPGKDFLASSPTNVDSPTNWTVNITHGGSSDGYGLQWISGSSGDNVAPGDSQTFTFDSTLTPAEMAGNSSLYPGTAVGASYVYSGAPFSDGGSLFIVHSSQGTPPPTTTDRYLVYSGTSTVATFSGGSTSSSTVTATEGIYLIMDLADNGSYSVLSTRGSQYTIGSRILSADGTTLAATNDGVPLSDTEPAHNLINGIENQAKSDTTSPTKGYALLRYSDIEPMSVTNNNVTHDYSESTEVYASGVLTGLSTTKAATIVAANAKVKVSGVYTVSPVFSAITNNIGVGGNLNTSAYPASLSGVVFTYGYDSTLVAAPDPNFPDLSYLSVSGKITLKLNPTLTALANVGGSFKLKGQIASTTIPAVAGPLTSISSPTIYEVFLYKLAKSLGLPDGYIPAP